MLAVFVLALVLGLIVKNQVIDFTFKHAVRIVGECMRSL